VYSSSEEEAEEAEELAVPEMLFPALSDETEEDDAFVPEADAAPEADEDELLPEPHPAINDAATRPAVSNAVRFLFILQTSQL
jgi:hypothetical protein